VDGRPPIFIPSGFGSIVSLRNSLNAAIATSRNIRLRNVRAYRAPCLCQRCHVDNRRGFLHRGERLLVRARFAREPTALILFDLDRFKSINDRCGHIAGDQVLITFCRLATSHVRPNDLFGRVGGEEFASLLPNTGRHDAFWLAERVRKAFEFHTTGQDAFRSTVSVGVAISDDERSDLNGLLSAADQALYRAKALGRNRAEPSPHWAERSTTDSQRQWRLASGR
jgi:diguanylate cyclase (GGDEF)-like protein